MSSLDTSFHTDILTKGLNYRLLLKGQIERARFVKNAKICSEHTDFVTEQVMKWKKKQGVISKNSPDVARAGIVNGLTVGSSEKRMLTYFICE